MAIIGVSKIPFKATLMTPKTSLMKIYIYIYLSFNLILRAREAGPYLRVGNRHSDVRKRHSVVRKRHSDVGKRHSDVGNRLPG